MAFNWATQKQNYRGRLQVNSAGLVRNNAPRSIRIESTHGSVTYVDCGVLDLSWQETMQGNKSVISIYQQAGWFNWGTSFYSLPWQSGYAARTQLGTLRNRFLTPSVNGCAVFVCGTRANPVVVHINSQPTDLLAPYREDLLTYFRLLGDVYTVYASKLVAQNLVPAENLGMLMPADYMYEGAAGASVFGVRDGADWSFYYTVNGTATGTTRRFWPA
jgi:hypothetical protein